MYFEHEVAGSVGVVSNSYQNGRWVVTVVRTPGVDHIWIDDGVELISSEFRCSCIVRGIQNGKVTDKLLLEAIKMVWLVEDWREDGF